MKEFLKKQYRNALSWIILISAILHGAYLLQLKETPFYNAPVVDAAWYHQAAIKIINQGWIGDSVFFMAPLYQYFLAVIYKLFGINMGMVLTFQAVLSVLSVWLIYVMGRELFDRRVGLISAALAAFHGVFIFYSGLLLKANLSVFFTCLFLVVFLKTYRNPSLLNYFFCGIILGILVPIRGNFLVVFAGFLAWFFLFPFERSRRVLSSLAFVLGAVL